MLREHRFGSLMLAGYSRSTDATVFHLPSFRLAFDLGLCPLSLIGVQTVALTHTHLDHTNGLPVLAAHRDLRGMPPPRVFAPCDDVALLEQLLALYNRLDRARSPYGCVFVGVEPGQSHPLDNRHRLRVLGMDHSVPTVGYVLLEQRRRLRPQFAGWPEAEIRAAVAAGIVVNEPFEHPLVCYLGDTAINGLVGNADALGADIVVVECTFIGTNERQMARDKGHLHLDDLVEHAALFRCRHLVLTHFSLRHNMQEIRQAVARAGIAFPVPVMAWV